MPLSFSSISSLRLMFKIQHRLHMEQSAATRGQWLRTGQHRVTAFTITGSPARPQCCADILVQGRGRWAGKNARLKHTLPERDRLPTEDADRLPGQTEDAPRTRWARESWHDHTGGTQGTFCNDHWMVHPEHSTTVRGVTDNRNTCAHMHRCVHTHVHTQTHSQSRQNDRRHPDLTGG